MTVNELINLLLECKMSAVIKVKRDNHIQATHKVVDNYPTTNEVFIVVD